MKILLATDGSKYAKKAAEKVCELIPNNDAVQIKIISVTETVRPIETVPFGVSNEFYARVSKDIEKASENFVNEAKSIIEENVNGSPKIETEVLQGFPREAIVDEAKT